MAEEKESEKFFGCLNRGCLYIVAVPLILIGLIFLVSLCSG